MLAELPTEGHVVADAEGTGERVETLVLRVVGEVRAGRARSADDDELDVAALGDELGEGGDGGADALAPHES